MSEISRAALFGKLNQPRLQGHRGRDGVLQAARQSVRRAGALDAADPADAGFRPASHRQAFRARSIAAREGRDRRARSAAARRDLDFGFFLACRERGRARLGLRDADVRCAAGPHRPSRGRDAENAVVAQRVDRHFAPVRAGQGRHIDRGFLPHRQRLTRGHAWSPWMARRWRRLAKRATRWRRRRWASRKRSNGSPPT